MVIFLFLQSNIAVQKFTEKRNTVNIANWVLQTEPTEKFVPGKFLADPEKNADPTAAEYAKETKKE